MINIVRRLGTLFCFVILMFVGALIDVLLSIFTNLNDAGVPIIALETFSIILLVNSMILTISSTRPPKQECKICFPQRPTWDGNFNVEVHQKLSSILKIGKKYWCRNLRTDKKTKTDLTWKLFLSAANCTERALKEGNMSVSVACHLLESEKQIQGLISHVLRKTRGLDVGVTVTSVEFNLMKRLFLALMMRKNPLEFPTSVTCLVFSNITSTKK